MSVQLYSGDSPEMAGYSAMQWGRDCTAVAEVPQEELIGSVGLYVGDGLQMAGHSVMTLRVDTA